MSKTKRTQKHGTPAAVMRGPLNGKAVAVLIEDQYQEMEVWYPIYRLREAGAKVVTVGTGRKASYASKLGYECPQDLDVHAANVDDFDGVIVPGGYAPDLLRRYDAVNTFVREAVRKGMLVGAICHGPWVLISADVLKGRTVTCFMAIRDDVRNAGATYVDCEVVEDKNLITARKPDDLPAFMEAVVRGLK